jgi:hypothetical protein
MKRSWSRHDGADISRPAEFLIDPSRKVRWANLTEDFLVRARPEEALPAFDAMNKSLHSGEEWPRLLLPNSRVPMCVPVNSRLVGLQDKCHNAHRCRVGDSGRLVV